ncbi:EXD1 [Symbiodinium sp. CCMP2592]|nr:EXD1 [Symbiodinium sp. CCMP2592]
MVPAFCRVVSTTVSRWSSGQLPRALLRTLPTGGHVRSCAASQRVHLVTSEAQGREACAALTQGIQVDPEREDGEEAELKAVWNPLSPTVALDCEGVRLGRFGRICLLQLQDSKGQVLLCDALRTGVVKALAPLVESRQIVKVIHDCREDSAALFHQHGIRLRAVFDTQAAHSVLEKRAGREAYQASASELLKQYLHIEPEQTELKSLMLQDPGLWARRPLSKGLVRYALHSVSHLRQLHQSLVAAARENSRTSLEEFARASKRAAEYRVLNSNFPTAQSMAKIGTRLWALVASRTADKLLLKLNAGRVGMVSTPGALRRFKEVQLGDLVLCCVSGVSLDGRYIYLDRYDHDWDFFDHQLRPAQEPEVGAYGREHRFRTSLFSDDVDPLLQRGLPGLQMEATDAWDASPEDLDAPVPETFEDNTDAD